MQAFQKTVFFVSRTGAILAGAIIIYMVCHILLEIFVRSVYSTSTFALDELIGYSVAACAYLGLGYTLEKGGLIRVNLVVTGSPRLKYKIKRSHHGDTEARRKTKSKAKRYYK